MARALPAGSARRGFYAGLGLGLAEDGELDSLDRELATAVPPESRSDLWFGVFAAVGERAWAGRPAALVLDGGFEAWASLDPTFEAARSGLAETLDGAPTPAGSLLPEGAPASWQEDLAGLELPLGRRAFGLRHPFRYVGGGVEAGR